MCWISPSSLGRICPQLVTSACKSYGLENFRTVYDSSAWDIQALQCGHLQNNDNKCTYAFFVPGISLEDTQLAIWGKGSRNQQDRLLGMLSLQAPQLRVLNEKCGGSEGTKTVRSCLSHECHIFCCYGHSILPSSHLCWGPCGHELDGFYFPC